MTIVLAVEATLSWALTWLLMKVGVDRMSWVGFGFLRPWMGLPFIVLFAWATDGFVFGSPILVLVGLGGGLLNAVFGTALFYYAHSHGTLHETNILANTSPFWGVVSAILVLGEPARLVTFGASALVAVGTIFLVRDRDGEGERRSLRASLAALGAGVLWGFTVAVPTKFCMDGGMSPIAYQLLFTGSAAAGSSVVAAPAIWRRLRFNRKTVWIAFASAFTGLFAVLLGGSLVAAGVTLVSVFGGSGVAGGE